MIKWFSKLIYFTPIGTLIAVLFWFSIILPLFLFLLLFFSLSISTILIMILCFSEITFLMFNKISFKGFLIRTSKYIIEKLFLLIINKNGYNFHFFGNVLFLKDQAVVIGNYINEDICNLYKIGHYEKFLYHNIPINLYTVPDNQKSYNEFNIYHMNINRFKKTINIILATRERMISSADLILKKLDKLQ